MIMYNQSFVFENKHHPFQIKHPRFCMMTSTVPIVTLGLTIIATCFGAGYARVDEKSASTIDVTMQQNAYVV